MPRNSAGIRVRNSATVQPTQIAATWRQSMRQSSRRTRTFNESALMDAISAASSQAWRVVRKAGHAAPRAHNASRQCGSGSASSSA
jgi:hypothetical protein